MLSTIEKALFLKEVNLFESMNAEQLKIISNISKEINVSSENVLFEEGDSCDYLYIIVEGEIDIVKALGRTSEEALATLGPPASFGRWPFSGMRAAPPRPGRQRIPPSLASKRITFSSSSGNNPLYLSKSSGDSPPLSEARIKPAPRPIKTIEPAVDD